MAKMKEKDSMYLPIMMWSILTLFYIYQFVARSAFPTVLTEEYMKFFCLDAQGVGALVSCYYFVYTFAQIPVGIIVDKYSTRLVAAVTAAICALGLILFVSTSNCYIAGFGQMLVGLGSAFSFIAVLKTIVNWFPREKNVIMTSYTMSIGCLGPVLAGPGVAVITRYFDWRNVILIFGFLGLVLAAVIWVLVRDKKKQLDAQETMPLSSALKLILTSPQAWVIAMFTMMLYAPLSSLGDLWGTSFIKKVYNADAATASLANNMIYLGLIFGCPFFAFLVTTLDSYKKPILIGLSMCAVTFGMVLFLEVPLCVMFCLLFVVGFSCGGLLGFSLGAMSFPESVSATVAGFINMASMISGVILMPLIGYMMDLSWNGAMENGIKIYRAVDFRAGFMSVFIALVLGILFALMLKDRSPKGR